MRILFCGDVVGQTGRKIVLDKVAELREKLDLDFIVVNGENAAHGFGITEKICKSFLRAGVDVVTTGNHVWDRREIMNSIDGIPELLRPMNYPAGTPGRGAGVFEDRKGRKVMVLHAMGRLFMDPLDDPFAALDAALEGHKLGATVAAVIVDFHAEATSEKMALGHYLDGRVSLVVGTHSHIPTADAHVLKGGAAYQTDVGMCGDYDSVIGMIKKPSVARFTKKVPCGRLEPAEGEATLCATFVEIDDVTGKALRVSPVRLGGHLSERWPE